MSKVLYRHNVSHDLPRAMGGDGCWIIDETGRRYLDASGGAAVSCLGHSNEKIRAALTAQVGSLAYAHTRYFTTAPMEELADLLVDAAPDPLSKVWFTSGGSEAIEAALKITRQYFFEIGQPDRRFIIGRQQGYHGSTTGALSAGGNAWRREPYASQISDWAVELQRRQMLMGRRVGGETFVVLRDREVGLDG